MNQTRPLLLALSLLAAPLFGSQVRTSFVRATGNTLVYERDAQGNRIPDFSSAGYGGGGVPLPVATARVTVAPVDGDDGARIQAALDFVASLAPDVHGLRGAVQLARGRYEISGQLKLHASGVMLRGAGADENGTVLVATGTDRRALIAISGQSNGAKTGPARAVTDGYVPVGAVTLSLANTDGLHVGDRVLVERPSTKEWIAAIGMDDAAGRQPFAWQPGKMNLSWERSITALDATHVTLDAPLTTALDHAHGGGTLAPFSWPGRVAQVGIENVRCESEFDRANSLDEQHAWMAITVEAAENAWIANVTAVHFASSAVQLGAGTRAITVQDCASIAPVSELGGYRRHSFHTSGQLTLFLRCRAEDGQHDLTVGYLTSGPNVFLECRAVNAHGFSGSIGSWASGALFDNVTIDGASLDLDNRETWNQGVGWAAANSVLWNCTAPSIHCRRPPTANNWAVGPWAEFTGDGWWDQVNEFVRPGSLYRAQLAARLHIADIVALSPRVVATPTTTIPTLESAVADLALRLAPPARPAGRPLALTNGWLVANGKILTGGETPLTWWRGWVIPTRAAELGAALTRFVPGQTGPGLTDDLAQLGDTMVTKNEVVIRQHYGLWYDRRRDDHERVRRASGDDWPPFFEQPFLRSGQGEAWDRLSRYDLTRYNPWYFARLREFADVARERGLVLIDEMYFQHNIIEAGAHWVDCPWRPANNINATGFPEPPPFRDSDGREPPTYEAGKRIFMAEQFYDVTHPGRRALHRAYIRQCLANLADAPNVIHTTSAEFSGTLAFAQFWLDVAAEWEAETGKHPLLALSAPKDVQDAILADPKRAAFIDAIDLTYWWRIDNGREFAPAGGTTTAPRQFEREWHGGRPSPFALAQMVRDYRERFPAKAVISGLEQKDGWAFVAAGGSLAKLPAATEPRLLAAIAQMQLLPRDRLSGSPAWGLVGMSGDVLLYAPRGGDVTLSLPISGGKLRAAAVDAASGRLGDASDVTLDAATKSHTFSFRPGSPAIVWLTK